MTRFIQWGGFRIGCTFWASISATFPFGKITVEEGSIQISAFFRRYHFARAEVRRLCIEQGVFCRGLVVEHDRPEYPAFVLFWSLAWSELAAALQQHGYRVYGS